MILIPAVDIKKGRCVRLRQGAMDQETVYGDDPVSMALRWVEEGAKRLHIVDLDGALTGSASNVEIIERILSQVKIPAQVGGGIRERATLDRYAEAGASGMILGTAVLLNRPFVEEACKAYPGKMIAGVDVRDGKVAVRGWTDLVEEPLGSLLRNVGDLGFSSVVVTDIGRDGMLQGPNLELLRELRAISPLPLIASGGVTTLEDIRQLSRISGLFGAIIGKALYAGMLSFSQALALTSD